MQFIHAQARLRVSSSPTPGELQHDATVSEETSRNAVARTCDLNTVGTDSGGTLPPESHTDVDRHHIRSRTTDVEERLAAFTTDEHPLSNNLPGPL